jgi:hypothetical protein
VNGDTPARRTRTTPWTAGSVLELIGGQPQTVYVSLEDGVPVFSQGKGAYREIGWQTNGYALVITFAFEYPITGVSAKTPSTWFSDGVPEHAPTSQVCCVPSVPGEYHFYVDTQDPGMLKGHIDPKIIVTPIING